MRRRDFEPSPVAQDPVPIVWECTWNFRVSNSRLERFLIARRLPLSVSPSRTIPFEGLDGDAEAGHFIVLCLFFLRGGLCLHGRLFARRLMCAGLAGLALLPGPVRLFGWDGWRYRGLPPCGRRRGGWFRRLFSTTRVWKRARTIFLAPSSCPSRLRGSAASDFRFVRGRCRGRFISGLCSLQDGRDRKGRLAPGFQAGGHFIYP